MVIIRLWYIFFILFKVVVQISGTTHWVVTENGRIQSHVSQNLCQFLRLGKFLFLSKFDFKRVPTLYILFLNIYNNAIFE